MDNQNNILTMDNIYNEMEEDVGCSDHTFQSYPNSLSFPEESADTYNGNEDSESEEFFHTHFNEGFAHKLPYQIDDKNRRIISRESLFQDPDSFQFITRSQSSINNQNNQEDLPQSEFEAGFDWTKKNWFKSRDCGRVSPIKQVGQTSVTKMKSVPLTMLPKTVVDGLSKPVNIVKAESMMQKMGWKGGALGKSGEGITEPIVPNTRYGTMRLRIGFGQLETPTYVSKKQQKPKKPVKPVAMKLKTKLQKKIYKTNVLNNILDFVRNDYEVELVFDKKLRSAERKIIHNIVNDVINCSEEDVIDMVYDSIAQMDILQEIKKSNVFVIGTQSEGQEPNRSLCLFKEAPAHMFLMTPADLKDDEEDDEEYNETVDLTEHTDVNNTKESDNHCQDNAMEADTQNSSITNVPSNIKNYEKSTDEVTEKFKAHCRIQDTVDPDILRKLVEYFAEFVEGETYMEFRFLGTYNKKEIETINYFLRNYLALVNLLQDKEDVIEKLHRKGYTLKCLEDDYGSILFLKLVDNNTND